MDLNTSIEELKLALQNSDAFCRYQKIREEVHHYPEKEPDFMNFEEKIIFYRIAKIRSICLPKQTVWNRNMQMYTKILF